MRFDKVATFVKVHGEEYNPAIGGMESKKEEDRLYCSYRSLGIKEQNELFGKVDVNAASLVIKGQGKNYDYIILGENKYKVLAVQRFRHKTGYLIGEV
nr:MAG TPA: head closure knob [Caudoviricetes sp.]